jgi:hypothetical protein
MGNLYSISGEVFYIGPEKEPSNVDFVSSDFTGTSPDQWIVVDGWMTSGRFGDNAAVITTPLINRGRDVKQKGTKNAGSMQNQFTIVQNDAGQAACIAAVATQNNYAMRISFPDGTNKYFSGLVMSVEEVGGSANTVRSMNVNVEINSNIVTV